MSAVTANTRALGHVYQLAAGVLITASGLWMLSVGAAVANQDWSQARRFALAGGVAIQLALALERRGVRLRREPSRVVGRSLFVQIAASGLVLAAGVGLVGIGYISSLQGWWPIGLTLGIPVLVVLGAVALNRRAAAIRLTNALHLGC